MKSPGIHFLSSIVYLRSTRFLYRLLYSRRQITVYFHASVLPVHLLSLRCLSVNAPIIAPAIAKLYFSYHITCSPVSGYHIPSSGFPASLVTTRTFIDSRCRKILSYCQPHYKFHSDPFLHLSSLPLFNKRKFHAVPGGCCYVTTGSVFANAIGSAAMYSITGFPFCASAS